MTMDLIIHPLRMYLIQSIIASYPDTQLHSVAFALRILDNKIIPELLTSLPNTEEELGYGGFPEVAAMGFRIGSNPENNSFEIPFQEGVQRLRERPINALETLAADDIAILGIADGLVSLNNIINSNEIDLSKDWLIQIIDSLPEKKIWTSRARDLARDLLDNRGRMRITPTFETCSAGALELCIRQVWFAQFPDIPALSQDIFHDLFTSLLKHKPPSKGQLEEAATWLKAIDLLIDQTSEELFSTRKQEQKAIALLSSIKQNLDKRAKKQANCNVWLVCIFLFFLWCSLVYLIIYLGWNVMEPWTYVIGISSTLGSYLYFAITQKEFSPRLIYERLVESKKNILYKKAGFDSKKYNELE